jgi:ABC-type glycerol-3-phosphate transport system permease component
VREQGRWATLVVAALVLAVAFPFYRAIAGSVTPEAQLFGGAPLWPDPPVL